MKSHIIIAASLVLVGVGTYYWLRIANAPSLTSVTVQRSSITQEVPATGNVSAPTAIDLQFLTGGKLALMNVKIGDKVSAGTLLARLDTSVLNSQIKQAIAALSAQRAQLATLQEGTRPEKLAITEAQIASDKTAIMQADQSTIDAIKNAYTTSDNALAHTVDHFFNNPNTPNPQIVFLASNSQLEAKLESERLVAGAALAAWSKSIAALSASADLSAASAEARRNLDLIAKLLSDSSAALSQAISSPQVSQDQLNQWMTGVVAERSALDAAGAALTSANTAQKIAVATLERDQKNLALEQAGSTGSTVSAQQAQVDSAQANVDALEAQRTQMQLDSPINGTVTNVVGDVGETISPGMTVITMLSDSTLQVDVNLSEDNVARAKVGQPARITLDAFRDETWDGVVAKIDPAETLVGGSVYYKTTIAFDRPDERPKPGMTANVWIQTGTASSTLVVPASAIQMNGKNLYVRVLRNGQVENRDVTTGLRNIDGLVEVKTGLSDRDEVLLGI